MSVTDVIETDVVGTDVITTKTPRHTPAEDRATIRPFTPDDYEGYCAVRNAVRPDYPGTVAEMRHEDETRNPKCLQGRWVAVQDGRIVGTASYGQHEWMYHPRKFGLNVVVHPEHQRRGIGTRLYDAMTAGLSEFDPITLRSFAREDETALLRFLERRGFVEEERAWESRLDVNAFDFRPYEGVEEAIHAHGVEIQTLREVMAMPGWDHKLYELGMALDNDVPTPEQITTPDFDRWLTVLLGSPELLPDGFFIAVHGEDLVGVSQLWNSQAHSDLCTGLTGVHRDWRRKGIALAMKVRAIRYAKEQGRATIRTDNSVINRPMLSINERLGFVKLPAWIGFVKHLAK